MDAIIARLSQLETHPLSLSELPTLVARLSSANEAQTSTIARLSSENANLRRRVREQDRLMEEQARGAAFEELDEENEAELAVERPANDEAAPHHINQKRREHVWKPFRPSSRTSSSPSFLDLINREVVFDFKSAGSFLASRFSPTTVSSPRISPLLAPCRTVTLLANPLPISQSQTATLSSLLPPLALALPPFPVKRLIISERFYTFQKWSPVLRFFNPQLLILDGSNRTKDHVDVPVNPSVIRVRPEELDCTLGRTCLESFRSFGSYSVPMIGGGDDTFALAECMLRGVEDAVVRFELVTSLVGGGLERVKIEEGDLSRYLRDPLPASVKKSKTGPCLRVTLVAREETEDQEEDEGDEEQV